MNLIVIQTLADNSIVRRLDNYDNYDKAIGQAYYELFYATQNADIKSIVCAIIDDMGHEVKALRYPEIVLAEEEKA